MKQNLLQFSAVVVGETHNPTILNPDFLITEGIVPKSWDWSVDDTMTTPPFAMVRYGSGVTVTVEQGKLQVVDTNFDDGPGKSKVSEIASAYVRTLRHVRYKAVGNNFRSVFELDSPHTFLKEQFLKDGPWNSPDKRLESVGFRLLYPLDFGKLTLSIDSGEADLRNDADKRPVVVANANFGRNCSSHPAFEEVSGYLGEAMQDWHELQSLLNDMFA